MFQSPSAHVGSPTPWETSRCPPAHHYPQPARHGSLPLRLLDAADVHARRQRPTIKRAAVAADVKLAGLALQIDLAVGTRSPSGRRPSTRVSVSSMCDFRWRPMSAPVNVAGNLEGSGADRLLLWHARDHGRRQLAHFVPVSA